MPVHIPPVARSFARYLASIRRHAECTSKSAVASANRLRQRQPTFGCRQYTYAGPGPTPTIRVILFRFYFFFLSYSLRVRFCAALRSASCTHRSTHKTEIHSKHAFSHRAVVIEWRSLVVWRSESNFIFPFILSHSSFVEIVIRQRNRKSRVFNAAVLCESKFLFSIVQWSLFVRGT